MHIPFVSLDAQHQPLRQALLDKMARLLDDGQFVLGGESEAFEDEYARYSGVAHAVGVGNGTDALRLCLEAAGIQPGDEVILPANTFVATALAVSATGAIPVPVDPDPVTANLTAEGIRTRITARTRAIIPVHLYGAPCPMDEILALAQEHGLYVVEDNAQAHGARYKNRRTGSLGHINATSFYPSKNLGALGDGGAITTQDPELARRVQLLRNFGSEKKYVHELAGHNTRLDTLQAAFLRVKLPLLDAWNAERQAAARRYRQNLASCKALALPHENEGHVYHLFVVRTPNREDLQRHLAEKNIHTQIHYPLPVHQQPAFGRLGYAPGDFPVAEQMSQEVLSLPLYIGLTDAGIDYVCEHITQFYK